MFAQSGNVNGFGRTRFDGMGQMGQLRWRLWATQPLELVCGRGLGANCVLNPVLTIPAPPIPRPQVLACHHFRVTSSS